MTNTKRKDRTEEFLKILKPLGFDVYRSSRNEQFYHPILGSDHIVDLSAMANTSEVVRMIFSAGAVVGMERQAKQIREILQISDPCRCSGCEGSVR